MLAARHTGAVLPARGQGALVPAVGRLAAPRGCFRLHGPVSSNSRSPARVVKGAAAGDESPSIQGESTPLNKVMQFWTRSPASTRSAVLLTIPLMWFISTTPLWQSFMEGIGGFVGKLFAPLADWLKENVFDTLQYRMLQVFSLPATGKLWAVFFVGAPVVYLGGLAYKIAAGVEWGEALARSYFTLNNVPGMDCTNEEQQMAGIVLNCIHIMSLFTFAILVGILTDDIGSTVEEVHSGNFAVPEKNHTVVVGWNSQVIPILHQIMKEIKTKPDGPFGYPILVLNPRPKEEMDEELLEEFGDDGVVGTKIISRSGYPLRRLDMERVAAGQAKTVLWMQPDIKLLKQLMGDEEMDDEDALDFDKGGGRDFLPVTPRLVSSLSSLVALGRQETTPQNIVFQWRDGGAITDDVGLQVAMKRFKSAERQYNIVQVSDMRSLTEVMAQCANQPGLADVFEVLFERKEDVNPTFGLVPVGHMAGWTFKDARVSFKGAVAVCGTLQAGLNPSDDYVLTKDDKVLILKMGPKDFPAPKSVLRGPTLPPIEKKTRVISPRHIVLISHEGDPDQLIESLKNSMDQESKVASTITVLTPEQYRGPSGTRRTKVKYMSGDLSSQELLVKAGVETADSVVLHHMAEVEPGDADCVVLADVMTLQAVLKKSRQPRQKKMNVICCVNGQDTREVIETITDSNEYKGNEDDNKGLHVDCVQPDQLLGGFLTQVVMQPDLRLVYEDMFDADGNEIYAKPFDHYSGLEADKEITWDMVQEIVRADGDLLIGYVDRHESVNLAVDTKRKVSFSPGDRLVVFAEDMY